MNLLYINHIAQRLGVAAWQVENCVQLLDDGCTVPFISRYRKERTGGLDDVQVQSVKHYAGIFEELEKRKQTVLETITEAGKLTADLKNQIESCVEPARLEDLYLPYRPKRKTRATEAISKGLEPLADTLTKGRLPADLKPYLKNGVQTPQEAIRGAQDIIAERISETAENRETLRGIFRTRTISAKPSKKGASAPEAQKYRAYFSFKQPLQRVPSHTVLALLRASDEGYLNLTIDADPEKCSNKLYYDFCQHNGYPSKEASQYIREAVEDSFKRLLEPSITSDILKEAKARADSDSIVIFGQNLRQLLLGAPLGGKRVMAIDPGFRTGCKVVCLDAQGNLLHHTVIFPHPPNANKIQAIQTVDTLVEKYRVEAIAIGSGTAGRETEDFIRRVGLPDNVKVFSVNEDGASVYSASDVGREEFPAEDVTVRGAVSIGRRLMDPLAELVKIDPKSLGVGQYQHDVDQKLLREKLDSVVESCVNSVGVQLNTASPYLLQYVSGIGPALARAITDYRSKNGPFKSRESLKKVPRLGDKAFQQCAGFLRIEGAANPLDNSAVHPEAYGIVERMAKDLGGIPVKEIIGNESLIGSIPPERYTGGDFGLPTIKDILQELKKPGRDPREEADEFSFDPSVHEIGDLRPGMELPGIVRNITAFGAFVNIGVHQDGLVHGGNIQKILRLGQRIKVQVISVDEERNRIGLRLCGASNDGTSGR